MNAVIVCNFCEGEVRKGTGIIYAKKDGTLSYFCSSKCMKNGLGLKREGRRSKWTIRARNFKKATASNAQKAAAAEKAANDARKK